MKIIIISTILLLINSFSFSQTFYGTVKDNQGEPIAYANVIALNTNNELITGVITDEDGKFELIVNSKVPFNIVISFIGYDDWEKEVLEINNTDLDVIILQESKNELDEVLIIGKKPVIQRKAGKLVFNLKNSVAANGFNGKEALKFAPKIDPTNEGIKMIGKSSLTVMVNDRLLNLDAQSLDSYLKSLRSENIDRIEIITNPPARYDASGNSGIVNIILKKNINSEFDGSVTSNYVQRSYSGAMPSAYLNHSTEKILVSVNLFADSETKKLESSNTFAYPLQQRKSETGTKQQIKGLSGGLNFEYKFNNNHKAGIILNSNVWKTEDKLQNITIFKPFETQIVDSTLIASSNNINKYNYLSASLYYDIKLDSIGSILQFNYNHLDKSNNDDRLLFLSAYEGGNQTDILRTNSALNFSEADYRVNSLNIDLELPIKDAKLGFGGKLTFLKNNSDIQYFNTTSGTPILDSNQSNVFAYDEDVYALYSSYQKPVGEEFYIILGLRYEYTQTKGNSITNGIVNKNTFNNLFPSLTVTYDPSDRHSFSMGYSKRIDRPSFSDINPFRSYTDFFSYDEGNPLLTPSITHNIDFSYIFDNNLEVTIYHTILKDAIDFITLTSEDTNAVISRPQNFYDQYTYGLDIYYNWSPTKWFNSNNGFSAYYNNSESKIPTITLANLSGSGYYISTRNTFTLNKEKGNTVYINFFQNFPETKGFLKTFNRANLQIGGKFSFIQKRLTLNISISDVFRQNRNRNREVYQNYTFNSKLYNDIRKLDLSLTYTFGNNKSKSSRRKIDDSDKNRL